MTPEEIGKELEQYDYEYYLNSALERVPEGIDTREGSIIYDALAPSSYTLAEMTMLLKNILLETFVQSATGGYLDLKAEEHGVTRVPATYAVAKARILATEGESVQVNIGERFSTVGDDPIYFAVTRKIDSEQYELTSETIGAIGNEYVGEILPIDNINDLRSASIIEITIPARDTEADDDLRQRILQTYQLNDFGGNIEDYIAYTSEIDSVGAVQIYPIWNGGGTVRVVILDNDFGIPSQTLINNVQEVLAPEGNQEGMGIAPIGHLVTVAPPTKKIIDVSLHVDMLINYTLDGLKPEISTTLNNLFRDIRENWSQHDDQYRYGQSVYRSQIISALLQIEGVANVSDVLLNGVNEDIELVLTNKTQEVAFLGDVTYT